MIVKSCFFIGHREESEEIYADLRAAVEQHIVEFGVTEFIVGQYGALINWLPERSLMRRKPIQK